MTKKDLVKSIQIVMDSLNSHLPECLEAQEEKECCQRAVGNPQFHRKTVKEYAFVIKTLSDLL